jgi:hypothetical protein
MSGTGATTTAFDREVRQLALDEQNLGSLVASAPLRRWAERNKFYRYIPTWILTQWDMEVSEDETIAPRPAGFSLIRRTTLPKANGADKELVR